MLFAVDLCLIAFLAYRAYIDGMLFSFPLPYIPVASMLTMGLITAMALDRFEMPFFGGLASSFVDAE